MRLSRSTRSTIRWCGLLTVLVTLLATPALAQDTTKLPDTTKLILKKNDEDPLATDTEVRVLQRGERPRTLPSRDELVKKLKQDATEDIISSADSKTEKSYEIGDWHYVLAKDSEGVLWESIYSDEWGYDEVELGEMTMRRVTGPDSTKLASVFEGESSSSAGEESSRSGTQQDRDSRGTQGLPENGAVTNFFVHWGWAVASLLALLGGGFLYWKLTEERKKRRSLHSRVESMRRQSGASDKDRSAKTFGKRYKTIRDQLSGIEKRVRALEQSEEVPGRKGQARSSSHAQAPSSSTSSSLRRRNYDQEERAHHSGSASSVRKLSTSEKAGEAFVEWCRNAGARVSRHGNFEAALQSSIGQNAQVDLVYRDRNNVQNVCFQSEKPSDAVEYWKVTCGREEFLFPQPQTAHGFRELEKCFEGQAVPSTLRKIQPARIDESGRLEKMGKVLT